MMVVRIDLAVAVTALPHATPTCHFSAEKSRDCGSSLGPNRARNERPRRSREGGFGREWQEAGGSCQMMVKGRDGGRSGSE